MAYVVEMSGKGYKDWEYVTRNENGIGKLRRIRDMIRGLRNSFGMAWDYKGFERQVRTVDQAEIFRVIANAAIDNMLPLQKPAMEKMVAELIEHMYDSVITSLAKERIPVTGGLASGLYITSMVGDGYNKTFVWLVQRAFQKLGLEPFRKEEIFIQGDDTSFTDLKVGRLQLADWLMTHFGAIGGTGKFAITSGRSEFLRVAYGNNEAIGYPARAVPGLTQRKPWSDAPQNETSVISGVCETVQTLHRRGGVPLDLRLKFMSIWCSSHKVSMSVLRARVDCGGCGISPTLGNLRVQKQIDKNSGRVKRLTEHREQRWKERAEELRVVVSHEHIVKLSDDDAWQTVVGDEIRGLSNANRKANMRGLRKAVVRRLPELRLNEDLEQLAIDIGTSNQLELPETKSRYKEFAGAAQTIIDLKLLVPKQWREMLKQREPGTKVLFDGRMSYQDAMQWYVDGVTVDLDGLHPLLSMFVERTVVNQIRRHTVPKARLADVVHVITARVVEIVRKSELVPLTRW